MFVFLFGMPYIIRVLISLLIILFVNKISKKLWLSVLIGTLIIAFWTQHHYRDVVNISWNRFSSTNNIFLLVVVFQIIWLSLQMALSGTMKDLVNQIKKRVSHRTALASLPAVIGLLPMPGGAIFSAPLIDDCDVEKKIEPILKTKINYWFRHIWEYWWPLYPGVLLAVDITGLPILTFMIFQIPLSLLSIFAGYVFLLRKVNININKNSEIQVKSSLKEFFTPLLPVIIIIIVYTAVKLFFPIITEAGSKYLPIIIAILVSQIYLQIKKPLKAIEWKKIIFSKKTLILLVIVAFIRIYGAFIEAKLPDGTFLMTHMRNELNSWNIPIILIIMIIPFISGLTTGLAIGFVGASFPIVMSLLGMNPAIREVLAATVLSYTSGYMGMILSPVHICLIVTNEHFKTNLIDSIIRLFKPVLIMIAGAVLMYFIIK